MWVARVGIGDARPNTATQSTNRLPLVPFPGNFHLPSNRHLKIASHGPTIDLVKGVVALPSAIARETYGEWMVGRRGAIGGNTASERRDPSCLTRSRYPALKWRRLFREGIQQAALQNEERIGS